MTEHDYFRQTLEGLKQSGEGLIQAAQGIVVANEGLQKAATAALTARDEHTDLRDTVHRLETLVLGLVQQVRELRGERGAP